jgi:hypothetical protein
MTIQPHPGALCSLCPLLPKGLLQAGRGKVPKVKGADIEALVVAVERQVGASDQAHCTYGAWGGSLGRAWGWAGLGGAGAGRGWAWGGLMRLPDRML